MHGIAVNEAYHHAYVGVLAQPGLELDLHHHPSHVKLKPQKARDDLVDRINPTSS